MTVGMIVYATAVGVGALMAGWALSLVLGMTRRPERFVWVGAVALTALASVAPLLLPATADARYSWAGRTMASAGAAAGLPASLLETPVPGFVPLWAASAVLLLLLGWTAGWRHRREIASLKRQTLHGVEVWMSDDEGPAVVGAVPPRIVLPRRVLDLPAAAREAVLAHEVEHLRARDTLLKGMACLLALVAPWNLAVWAALRRLDVSLERDCDLRTLRRQELSEGEYARVLLLVAEWGTPRRAAPLRLAMGRSARDLKRRLEALLRPDPPRRTAVVAALVLAAVGVLAPLAADPPRRTAPIHVGGVLRAAPGGESPRSFQARELTPAESGGAIREVPGETPAEYFAVEMPPEPDENGSAESGNADEGGR